jgi:hypothetical protein
VAKGLRTAGQGLRIVFGVRVSQEEKDRVYHQVQPTFFDCFKYNSTLSAITTIIPYSTHLSLLLLLFMFFGTIILYNCSQSYNLILAYFLFRVFKNYY